MMNDFLVPLEVEPWFMQLVKFIVFKSDLEAQLIFIYTYSQYATAEDLFLSTEDLYLTTGFDKGKVSKLVEFLYLWLNKEEPFDRKLKRKVLELARLYVPADSDSAVARTARCFRLPTISMYQKFVDGFSSTRSEPLHISPRSIEHRHSICLGRLHEPFKVDVLKYKTSALAKQLTLIDHELTSALSLCELRNKILKPGQAIYESVAAVSTRFNQMSFWVATQIVTATSAKLRIDIIEKFIAIAMKLMKYKNFLGVFQILSGLHNANIRRLKSCWKDVSQRSSNSLQRIEQTMSHTNNYSHYRSIIRECTQKSTPAVPLICLLLQDLTFINDGNENETTDGKPNFEKWNMFGSCMLGFSKLMEKKYPFRKNSAMKKMLLNDLVVLPETLLMKHSFAIETRKRPCHGTSF